MLSQSEKVRGLRIRARTDSKSTGIALITVLLLIALLTLVAVSVLGISRARSQISSRHADLRQRTEMLDSAIRVALAEVSAPRAPQSALIIGDRLQHPVDVFRASINVEIELESRRVDINFADESTLTFLFASQGHSSQLSRQLAARVIDWRDPDDTQGVNGAERAEYQHANRGYGPRNGPFESVGELRQVLGLETLTDEQLDSFTVFSHSPTPIANSTLKDVQRALEQSNRQPNGDTPNSNLPNQNQEGTSLAGQVVRARACATTEGSSLCRVAVIRLTGNPSNPFLVFQWQSDFSTSSTDPR